MSLFAWLSFQLRENRGIDEIESGEINKGRECTYQESDGACVKASRISEYVVDLKRRKNRPDAEI